VNAFSTSVTSGQDNPLEVWHRHFDWQCVLKILDPYIKLLQSCIMLSQRKIRYTLWEISREALDLNLYALPMMISNSE